jgi:hypothetical protein
LNIVSEYSEVTVTKMMLFVFMLIRRVLGAVDEDAEGSDFAGGESSAAFESSLAAPPELAMSPVAALASSIFFSM